MKKFLLLSSLGIALSSFALFKVNVFDFHHIFGRCEGSDYCRICTNCSRCGYCKGGGTCGVCYTPKSIVRRSAPPKSNRIEKSVSSNRTHTFDSRTPAVKRYYLRKPSSRKYSSSGLSKSSSQSESELVNPDNILAETVTSSSSLINKSALSQNEPLAEETINSTGEKELFTIDIPENADFVRVSAVSANLRADFSTKSPVLQRLNHGDLLIKLKAVRGWVKVQTLDSGEVGYVFANLLK